MDSIELDIDNETILKKHYYNLNHSSSFKSPYKLYLSVRDEIPGITLKNVKNWLLDQEIYGIHQQYKRNFPKNPFVARNIDHSWHMDLVEISKPQYNSNYKYILMAIDTLSKYGMAEKMKNKKGSTVIDRLKSMFKKSKRKPRIIITDAGKEFLNRQFKNFLKSKKIKHQVIFGSPNKAAIVERWNRTIKEIIQKYMSYNNTYHFIHVLQKIVDSYNRNKHSRTKFRPIDVSKYNERQVYRNLYKINVEQQKPNLKIGDKVRVQYIRSTFEKGYKPNFSSEIFKISKILWSSPFVKYKVIDNKRRSVKGSYYEKELLKLK